MSYQVETNTYKPDNLFAGDFPTVIDTATASVDIKEFSPVIVDIATGTATVPTAETAAKANAIAATDATANSVLSVYLTGEFNSDAIVLPEGVEVSAIKAALRAVSIYLK